MKKFAVALLAGIMVLESTALGDEIVFDDGFAAEYKAIEISADDLLEEADFADYEDEYFVEEEFEEGLIEEIPKSGFSEDEENLDVASLIEDFEETADEDAFALADDEGVPIDEAHFPDRNFRTNYVMSSQVDKDGNGFLSSVEINAVKVINVEFSYITSLQGIEYFTAIEELNCDDNHLTSLDVSQNTALKDLSCLDNQLMSLDVSQNTALKKLNCSYNYQLTSLDVSQNTALEWLNCSCNQLTSLDVSQNTALTYLNCSSNQLTSLDVSHNTTLEWLDCSYNYNQLTSLDVSQNTALEWLDCSYNQLTDLDISKCPYLEKAYTSDQSMSADESVEYYEYWYNDTYYWLSVDSSVSIITSTHTHSYVDWMIITPATCVTEGVQKSKCTGCDAEEVAPIPATGIHTPVTDAAVPATTTSEGKTEGSHCSVCGTILVAQQTVPMIAPPPAAPVAVPEQITVTKKPTIKKPETTANKITINWTNIKTTSKKTKAVWKKIKKTQIQCATDKAFKNIVKTTTVGKNKTKAVIKGLKKNTTYYVRVRYFDGTGYSKWSSVKKIKTKKK